MGLIKLSEAVELLEKHGILAEGVKQKEQAVKRLLHQGLILGVQPPQNQPKIGWKVDEDSLNEYIQIGDLKKHEMVKELITLRRKLRELEMESPVTHVPEKEQEINQEENEENSEGKELVEDAKIENKAILEGQEFDFSRVEVKYPKKPKELEKNRYSVEFTLNGEKFTSVIEKKRNSFVLHVVEKLDGTFQIEKDKHGDYFAQLEEQLIPKVQKKIK